jgi:hypothetical protein
MTRRIVPIVEGHSEADSIPAFLRRILHDQEVYDIEPDSAIREHRQRLVKTDVFLNRLRMAQLRDNCAAILVVFDADDDAACILGPQLLKTAQDHGIGTPCRVVLAVREIEAWLIAGVESLRGCRGVPENLSPPDNVEAIRGAKEWLGSRMRTGYKGTIDQLPLLLRFDYQDARRRAPSLDKFLRDLDSLTSTSSARP